jgi:hypothetical protein
VSSLSYRLTDLEAQLALTKAGYQAGQDGLWRPSVSEEGAQHRKVLEEIEARAWADMEESWSDDIPIGESEAEDDDASRDDQRHTPGDSAEPR